MNSRLPNFIFNLYLKKSPFFERRFVQQQLMHRDDDDTKKPKTPKAEHSEKKENEQIGKEAEKYIIDRMTDAIRRKNWDEVDMWKKTHEANLAKSRGIEDVTIVDQYTTKKEIPAWVKTEDRAKYVGNLQEASRDIEDFRKKVGLTTLDALNQTEADAVTKSKKVGESQEKMNRLMREDKTTEQELKNKLASFQKEKKISRTQHDWILKFRFFDEDDLRRELLKTKLGEESNFHLISDILKFKTEGKKAELDQYLGDLEVQNLITTADRKKIDEAVITDKEFDQHLRRQTGLSGREINTLTKLKQKHQETEEEISKTSTELTRSLDRHAADIKEDAATEIALKDAGKSIGIELKAGVKLVYQKKEFFQEKDEVATLNSIGQREAVISEIIAPNQQNIMIKLKLLDPSGDPNLAQPLTLTLAHFDKWVQRSDAVEKIDTLTEIDRKIKSLNEGFAVPIKAGSIIEIEEVNTLDPGKKKIPRKIKITKVDEKKKLIHLDQKVLFKSDGYAGEEKFQSKDVLTYGEFLRWYLSNKGEKDYSKEKDPLQQLREDLKKLKHGLRKKFKLDPKEYPDLKVEPGELLYCNDGSDKIFQIQDVAQDKILLTTGAALTLPQFFRWVKDNHVEKRDSDAEATKQRNLHLKAGKNEVDAEKAAQEIKLKMEADKAKDEQKAAAADHEEAAERVSTGYFKDLWDRTTFLSLRDVFRLAGATWEFIKRKNEVWSKDRMSKVGRKFPSILGTEFKKINQQTENEEVNQYKEGMDQMGVDEIKEILYKTRSKHEAKACIILLTSKGQIRWDDRDMWNALDRFSGCRALNGFKIKVEDDCQKVMDYLWGADSWRDWYNSNESNYRSKRDQFKEIAKKVESDPKGTFGLRGELKRMLYDFLHGEYVDPAQYEAMIFYAIDAGKLAFEEKLYFIVMGIGAKNVNGKTILSRDRIDVLEGELLTKFPVLDFFISKDPDQHGWTTKTFEHWIEKYISTSYDYMAVKREKINDKNEGLRVPEQFRRDFVEKEILKNQDFLFRLSKTIRYAENWDHDDMHIFGPLLDEMGITKICSSQSGSKDSVTVEGHKNVHVGFNQQLRGMMLTLFDIEKKKGDYAKKSPEELKKDRDFELKRIAKLLKAQVKFDAIMQNRYQQGDKGFARLSEEEMDSLTVVGDKYTTRKYRDEVTGFIKDLAKADFFRDYLETIDLDKIYDMSRSHIHTRNRENEATTNKIDEFVNVLGTAMTEDMSKHNGQNFMNFIKKGDRYNEVKGLPTVKEIDYDKREKEMERKAREGAQAASISLDSQQKLVRDYRKLTGLTPEQIQAEVQREVQEEEGKKQRAIRNLMDKNIPLPPSIQEWLANRIDEIKQRPGQANRNRTADDDFERRRQIEEEEEQNRG